MNEQHSIALAERRMRSIGQATRLVWNPVDFQGYVFNVGIEVRSNEDLQKINELDLSKTVDKISSDMLISNSLDLIVFSDHLFQCVTEYFLDHAITVDVVYLDQPVLSTNYNFNNPPF
jgi:hypothetical protein